MSVDSAPLSEGRSVPSSTSRDADAGTRSPGLDFFRVNPFRTLRVPIRIPSQEALWKSEKALSRLRAGLDPPEPDLVPWLAAPDEFDIREGAQKMEEPLRRLREQLLWFDFALDPRGATLEEALSAQAGPQLANYLATDVSGARSAERAELLKERGKDDPTLSNESSANLIAHRVNQANLRLLLGLSELHGVEIVERAEAARAGSPPALEWKAEGGLKAAMDPHLVLAGALKKKRKAEQKASYLGEALARWGALLKDPAFTPYVQAEIESLGDELVGKDDVETITYAVSSALADIIVGEARLQMSHGAIDEVLHLTKLAAASGIDPVFWTTAFKPLRTAFQAEVTELDALLEGNPRINDVDLYLARLETLVKPWAKVKDGGVLGLDQLVDTAVITAVDAIRALDHPAVVLDRIFEVLRRAEEIARSESAKERSREYRTVLQKYRDVLCHFCTKRGAEVDSSVVLKGKKLVSSEYVGYNTIRNTFGLMAGLIPRCATCAELHGWMHYFVRAMWVAAAIGAPFLLWLVGESAGFMAGLVAAAALLGASWIATRIAAKASTPTGETAYWSYSNTQGYRRMASEGYSITKHDYRKDAYARLKMEGLTG
jgi:hypothetical protein